MPYIGNMTSSAGCIKYAALDQTSYAVICFMLQNATACSKMTSHL